MVDLMFMLFQLWLDKLLLRGSYELVESYLQWACYLFFGLGKSDLFSNKQTDC